MKHRSMVLVAALALQRSSSQSHTQQPQPSSPAAGLKLKQAHVVFRHGARTPVFYLPGLDSIKVEQFRGKCSHVNIPPGLAGAYVLPPVDDKPREARMNVTGLDGASPRPHPVVDSHQLRPVFGECRAGQLTDLGAEQSAALGRELKARYGDLMAMALERENGLFIRSSNVARCIATMGFVLGAMESGGDLPPVRTTTADQEWLYPNSNCVLTAQLMKAASEDWRRNPGEEAKQLVEELRRKLPADAFEALRLDTFNFVRVRDFFSTFRAHKLPIPWNVDEELCNRVERLGSLQVARYLYHGHAELGDVSAKVGVGALLGVIANALLPADAAPRPIVSLISGHDTTLMPLMSVFAWDGTTWPDFCAYIAVELWGSQDDAPNQDEVRIVYSGKVVRVLTPKEFASLVTPLIPKDWAHACLQERADLPNVHGMDKRGDHW